MARSRRCRAGSRARPSPARRPRPASSRAGSTRPPATTGTRRRRLSAPAPRTRAGVLHRSPGPGRQLVLRGSNVCLYVLREASQVKRSTLMPMRFSLVRLRSPSVPLARASRRVSAERASEQLPPSHRRLFASGRILLRYDQLHSRDSYESAILRFPPRPFNSKLIDSYFRLGSTNSKVDEYRFNNLPCPLSVKQRRTMTLRWPLWRSRRLRKIRPAQPMF